MVAAFIGLLVPIFVFIFLAAAAVPIIDAHSAKEMEAYPVSRHVNSLRNNDPECF